MKYYIVISLAILLVFFSCTSQKRVAYEFPEAMAKDVQAAFSKQCEKGLILYNMNCAKCHNVQVKGKEMIPDFTADQIKGYELRVSNAQHETSMPDELVTAEELGLISTFLNYKKKSGIKPFHK